jgi:hypothetical protein
MSAVSLSRWFVAASLVLSAGLAACTGSGSPTAPGTDGGGAPSSSGGSANPAQTGTGPFSEAEALLVTFSSVSVHRADGDSWQTVSNTSRTCDLKKLEGPVDLLGVASLPVGKYTQVRLVVSSANIYFDTKSAGSPCAASMTPPAGDSAPVEIPSGEVKLNHEFTLTSAGTTMLLDFDGDRSVRQTGSGNGSSNGGNGNGKGGGGGAAPNTKYMMSPVIRVVSVQ